MSSPSASAGNLVTGATSASTVVDGGYIGKLMQGSTQVGAIQLNSVKFDNRPGYAIQGTAPYRTNGSCQKINIFFSPVGIPTDIIDLVPGTPGLAGAGTAGTFGYTSRTLVNQRVSQMVVFTCTMVVSSISGAPAGATLVSGFPFAANVAANAPYEFLITSQPSGIYPGTNTRLTVRLDPGSSVGIIIESLNGAGGTVLQAANLQPGTYTFGGCYLTN